VKSSAQRPRNPGRRAAWAASRAFTLVELMVVVAVAVIIIGLAAPSFSDYIVTQRARSIHAQLSTDLQFARSEAVSRRSFISVRFQSSSGADGASCYIIFTRPDPVTTNPVTCDCLAAPGSRCNSAPADTSEVRTVTVPNRLNVSVRSPVGQPDTLTFDPRTGGLRFTPLDVAILSVTGFQVNTSADSARTLRAVVNGSGRATICTPTGSTLGGSAC
jgi:type IV fimbrial biogenesis protein FimT